MNQSRKSPGLFGRPKIKVLALAARLEQQSVVAFALAAAFVCLAQLLAVKP